MEAYYFHGFRKFNMKALENVMRTGFILPRDKTQIYTDGNNLYNGDFWISLCQKTLIDDYYYYFGSPIVSYDAFIYKNICVVIDPEKVEGARLVSVINSDYHSSKEIAWLARKDNYNRISCYEDEIQTNVPVPTSSFLAVGYPLINSKSEDEKNVKYIYSLLDKYNLNIPVLDSSIYSFADDTDEMKKSKILIK